MVTAREQHGDACCLQARCWWQEDLAATAAFSQARSSMIRPPRRGIRPSALNPARIFHTATLLPNGQVLVAGEYQLLHSFETDADVYDPATQTWNPTGSLNTARSNHTATLLPSGKVLVAGERTNSAELFDPATGTWSPTGPMVNGRSGHRATRCCPTAKCW